MQKNKGKQRMGKTRDLFKKIRDTKGTFHAKMGSIKDRNGPGHAPRNPPRSEDRPARTLTEMSGDLRCDLLPDLPCSLVAIVL